ncbi:MAG: hypothetical protein OHK93_004571 [Ramalina farinacea]|uniref:hydroxymethylglutaryl-CoA lyase n=1 Tax=Ramalina farinacea TaxID=258253 RepID=A0AA43QXL3_9LECA|nr:hypothetical protein [Ramalina farinacea]
MANSADILESLNRYPPAASGSIAYNFLVPNLKGLENLLRAYDAALPTKSEDPASLQHRDAPLTPPPSPKPGQMASEPAPITSTQHPNAMGSAPLEQFSKPSLDPPHTYEISVFLAATEAFSRANTNCSIAESIDRCKAIISLAKSRSLPVRGYVSVALGCPYEGPSTPPSEVAEITASLLEMGVDEVSVADTTGMGTAPKTRELLKALFAAGISPNDLALHFHDTYGQALVNAVVGLEHGIRTFDSSVGGLGGCPFSKGATGNVSTEDLVHCLHSLGATTGVDLEEMSRIGGWISEELGRPNESRAGKAILSRLNS